MKKVVYLSQRTNWEIGWATKILLNGLGHSDLTPARIRIHIFLFFFFFCNMFVIDELHFFSIIPKSSVKFLLTKSLRSLVQDYPSINHWWSITFATLPSIEIVEPILLSTRTRYAVASNWYTFTHIYIWSLTSRERPESIIQCMT